MGIDRVPGKSDSGMWRILNHIQVMKVPLSLLITISAVFGFVVRKNSFDAPLLLTGVGVFLLACGGAALNNFQDRHVDGLLSRTKDRPLPAGHLPPARALLLSAALVPIGLTALYLAGHDIMLPVLGGLAILLYNGIYTPYKQRVSFAMIAGVICGMLPPLIGWTAAGGGMLSARIWIIMAIFGFWQLPHFWLILLNHWPDYPESMIPKIVRRFNRRQLEKLVFIWIFNFAVLLLAVPIVFMKTDHFTGWIVACAAISLMIMASVNMLLPGARPNYHRLFTYLNGTILFVMIIMISEAFLLA